MSAGPSTSSPRVLLVTSAGAPPDSVVPVLSALEATEMRVRAIDAGRAGRKDVGTMDRVMRAIVGEMSERRLGKEMQSWPPDVTVAFDAPTTQALTVARDSAAKPAPVVAVIAALSPGAEWNQTDADRYVVVDDEAAVALSDHGVEGDRIMVVGPFCGLGFALAGGATRESKRSAFSLPKGPVVVVEVAGLGYDATSQIALQLSLCQTDATYLFDAGDDSDAATALRSQVPALGMKAKLFGVSSDVAAYWRCADVVVARPSARAVANAMVVGARFVAFGAEDADSIERAAALETRNLGARAPNALLLSSALEPLLSQRSLTSRGGRIGKDGAGTVADVVWIVGRERNAVIDERLSEVREQTQARVRAATTAADAAAKATAPAGGLEDLSGGTAAKRGPRVELPSLDELAGLRAELSTRLAQVSKAVLTAREAAEMWSKRVDVAKKKKNEDLARAAQRNADSERARMHASLAEMGQLQAQQKGLERAETQAKIAAARAPRARAGSTEGIGDTAGFSGEAPPRVRRAPKRSVDEMLRELKRQSGGTSNSSSDSSKNTKAPKDKSKKRRRKRKRKSGVDAELDALKRKMSAKGGKSDEGTKRK